MSLKSLNQFNQEKLHQHDQQRLAMQPHPNGIECPQCGKELWDSDPTLTLTSYPAKKNIHCPECGFTGYRLA